MNIIPATEEEKEMAREFYSHQKGEVKLEIAEFSKGTPTENSLAETDVFKEALLTAQFCDRMEKELAVPAEKFTKKYLQDTYELMVNVCKRYDCSLGEAFVKLTEFNI